MLDHDNDFLPEEQAHPEVVQKLQAMYQMKPQAKQVLIHVQERLVSHASLLPAEVQANEHAETAQAGRLVSFPTQPARARQSRRRFIALAAILCLLMLGAVALTFSTVLRPAGTFRLVLVPEQQASASELALVRSILLQRFNNFGLQGVSIQLTTANRSPEILVDLPHFGGNETLVLNTLTERGILEFWDTGPAQLQVGAQLDPVQYTSYNPGDRPRFTGQDLDPNQISTAEISERDFAISFAMKRSSSAQFDAFTRDNIGSYLTITLDRKVLFSAAIQSEISELGAINGNFTQQQAEAVASALKSGALPIALQQQG